MNKLFCLFLVIVIVGLGSCQSNSKEASAATDVSEAISGDSIKKYVSVLAADSFWGRKPFTAGEKITTGYLQGEFKRVGLEPGNGDSYLQEVPMVNITCKADESMLVESAKGKLNLKGYDDFAIWTDKDSSVSLDKTELVFAGFGVVAPEYGWNDYAGLDVKGKVVLVMVNDPGYDGNDSTFFKGKTMTYYGRWTYKFEEAARQGAKGCLIIHNTYGAGYPFTVVQNSWNASKLHLDNRGKNIANCDVIGWVTSDAAIKLLKAAGKDSSLLKSASQKGFKSVPLELKLSTKIQVNADYNKSYNVIGKITGSKHPDEYIVYTAHWDHLGIGKPDEKGDSIYNGAIDNASGTAGILEIARAFKSLKNPPERTIVILSVTAEEQGLVGSAWYAQNPVYPNNKTLANINIDGLLPSDEAKDIIVIGQGQSDIEDDLKEAAEKAGRYIAYEVHPEAGYYFRSDHFNFAKAGVPALFTANGIDIVGKGKEFGKKLEDDYTEHRYHRPSDQMDTSWTFKGGVADLKLMFEVGLKIANREQWPKWKETSEFKALRK